MEKTVAVINDELGTIALGFSKAGYEVKALYLDSSDKNAINICKKNWGEKICIVDLMKYSVSNIIDAEMIAGKINIINFSVAGKSRIEEINKHAIRVLELLKVKRPQAFLFHVNRINNNSKEFRSFLDEIIESGYEVRWDALNVNSYTGMPVNEKEYFIYGSRNFKGNLLLLEKEPDGINYSIADIYEKEYVVNEWYYHLASKYIQGIERKKPITFLCWKRNHYEETENVMWNPGMIPLIAVEDEIRKITHKEIARLKGIPDEYFLDFTKKTWIYQKLMFCANVSLIQRIVSSINYALGERIYEYRATTKGKEFEEIVENYFKYKKITIIKSDIADDSGFDFKFTVETSIFLVTLKIYSGNVGLEKRIINLCGRLTANHISNDETHILMIANIVDSKIKRNVKEKFDIEIWDVGNLLWMFEEFPQIKSEFISILSYTTSEIELQKPNMELLEQKIQQPYNDELQEKLRKIRPGKEDATKYEKLCIEILKYLFSDDLEFIGEQRKSNDDLYRFDYCCKIKYGDLKEFFDMIQKFFNTKYIVFEFKNYSKEITQKEIYTTEKYLYAKALRKVAVIISRKGADENAHKAARGCLRESGKLIICLSDEEINELIDVKSKFGYPGDVLEAILDDMLMDLEK